MSERVRLIWICPEFTPYHEALFQALALDNNISLRVEVMMGPTEKHPFKLGKERPFEWGLAKSPDLVDRALIKRVLQEKKAWIVVASYLKPTLMATMKALAAENRRFLHYTDTPLPQDVEWNAGMPRRRSWMRRWARRRRLNWIFNHAYRVLATGLPGVDAVVRLGCQGTKAIVFPYWVALPKLATENRRQRERVLLGVGQLVYRKGYDIALHAFANAINSPGCNDLCLKLIGAGEQKENLEGLILKLGIENRVELKGWLQPTQIREELLKASAFIHTARWEPFGVSVLEAMAAGLPVLGSDQTMAVLDRVENNVSGFIHRTGNIEQLADHIIQVFANTEGAVRMGLAARRKAEEWPPERGVQIIKSIILNECSSSNA